MTNAMWRALRASQVIVQVSSRLTSRGSIVELGHLLAFSDDEIEILVRQERGVA